MKFYDDTDFCNEESELPKISLVDADWCLPHHTEYTLATCPEAEDENMRHIPILKPTPNARIAKLRQPNNEDKAKKKTPVLFRKFISYPRTTEAMLDFARSFGPIAYPFEIKLKNRNAVRRAVTMPFIIGEHWLFSLAVRLWEGLNGTLTDSNFFFHHQLKNDTLTFWIADSLADFHLIESVKRAEIGLPTTPIFVISDERDVDKPLAIELSGILKGGDSHNPKDYYPWVLQRLVNAQLKQYPVTPFLNYDMKMERYKQGFRPSSLLSYMWYEFFQSITGEKTIKQCSICHEYSDVTNLIQKTRWEHHSGCASLMRTRKNRGKDVNAPIGKRGRPKKVREGEV